MTVEAFDAERHHVGLGEDASSLSGFVTVGPIAKERATALFEKPSNVGSVEDLIGTRTHSVWTQDDFSGGEFQLDWSDPAMFSECVGMLPNQLGRSLLSVRPIQPWNLNDTGASLDPISADVIDNALFVIYNTLTPQGRVLRYALSNGALSSEVISSTHLPSGKSVTAVAWNTTSGRVWIGSDEPEINTFLWVQGNTSGNRLVHKVRYKAPTYSADPVTRINGIHLFGALKFITTRHGDGFMDDNRVWIHVSGQGDTTKWKQVGTLPGDYITSVTYNNAVYFLTRKGDSRTQLSMSQGDQVFPVLDFPYAFRGLAMVEYAGRLYISGVGYDLEGNPDHGELYEVNGTSLRLVRTWASEVDRPDPDTEQAAMGGIEWVAKRAVPPPEGDPGDRPKTRKRTFTHMAALAVAEGLLWMPDSSYSGLEAYDATTDGFFGGPRVSSGNDTDLEFTHLIPVGQTIFGWASHRTLNSKQGIYRTGKHGDAPGPYESTLTTSDFHPEPARSKQWSRVTVHHRGTAPVALLYSTDGGDTFTYVDADREDVFGYRRETSFDLSALTESRLIRLRFQFQMEGTAGEPVSELIAFSLSFLVRGESKRRWTLTVNASSEVADLENGMLEQSAAEVKDRLWALAATDGTLTYRDTDGTDYSILVSNIQQSQPVVTVDKEAYVSLTLMEV